MMSLLKKITGIHTERVGTDTKALLKLAERDRFSDYLPWISYDEETKLFYNGDGTCGWAWNCVPLFFAGTNTSDILEGLLRINLPENAVLQFILYADPDINDILEKYCDLKASESEIVSRVNECLPGLYKGGEYGLKAVGKIPLRHFRLIVTVKYPQGGIDEENQPHTWTTINELLTGAMLQPRTVTARELLKFVRQLVNPTSAVPFNLTGYNDYLPLKRQVITCGKTEKRSQLLVFGDERIFRCITPATFPPEIDEITVNKLFGGIDGVISDENQIPLPFMFTMNVILNNQMTSLHRKANLVLRQQAVGSFAPSLMRKKDEYLETTDALEKGIKFYQIMPVFWIYGEDEKLVNEAIIRSRRIWEGEGFIMQEDRGILIPLFLNSLPFGLNTDAVAPLERQHVWPSGTIATGLPVQGDFSGFGAPVALFVGRKGELFGGDVYSSGASNYNVFMAAGSGGGKSFLTNYFIYNYYSMGNIIRVMDIGHSYRKMTKMFNARYLDFSNPEETCLNPFTNISPSDPNGGTEDQDSDLAAIPPILAQMVFNTAHFMPTPTDMRLLGEASRWAFNMEGNDADIGTVNTYLSHYMDYDETGSLEIQEAARKLAFNIRPYTPGGLHGRFFNGRATFDISSDDFVVLELDNIRGREELFRVVTMQLINATTQEMYLSQRDNRRRMFYFDEAYLFLDETSHIMKVIEEAYRRSRKYGGSFWTITQSIMDILNFGKAGAAIMANSATKFYMESTDFNKAHHEKIIDYDEFTMRILKSLKTKKRRYSEVFMDTACGMGVGRLVVDPFSYYVFTSDQAEVAEIEAMIDQGVSYVEAIENMVEKYHRIRSV